MSQEVEVIKIEPLTISGKEAAKYLGIADITLRASRVTGKLCGIPSPEYKKIGKKVVYEIQVLNEWLRKVPSFNKTSDEYSIN